jgi:hypothetical protein
MMVIDSYAKFWLARLMLIIQLDKRSGPVLVQFFAAELSELVCPCPEEISGEEHSKYPDCGCFDRVRQHRLC